MITNPSKSPQLTQADSDPKSRPGRLWPWLLGAMMALGIVSGMGVLVGGAVSSADYRPVAVDDLRSAFDDVVKCLEDEGVSVLGSDFEVGLHGPETMLRLLDVEANPTAEDDCMRRYYDDPAAQYAREHAPSASQVKALNTALSACLAQNGFQPRDRQTVEEHVDMAMTENPDLFATCRSPLGY